jgi:superfamily I DNA/RNA helicase
LCNPAEGELEGFVSLPWSEAASWAARSRGAGLRRPTLKNPIEPWLAWLDQADVMRVGILDVCLDGAQTVADLLGIVVEPALRRGVELAIVADRPFSSLEDSDFVEPDFGYAYSLTRLRWRLHADMPIARMPRELVLPDIGFPDRSQAAAIGAKDGVVQIIAPAGSGKTAVLVERALALHRGGVPADAIACLTFNRAARFELRRRLRKAGVGVQPDTFHSFGMAVLRRAHRVPRNGVRSNSIGTLRHLRRAAKEGLGHKGVWIDIADLQRELSNIKLKLLMTAEEYAATLTDRSTPFECTMAVAYTELERWQREQEIMDYDDQILRPLRLLREDQEIRESWQDTYRHVLVDEYQDIEPAQELLVRIVAAPHDNLFCVGDEDQTLYAFRRASVARIICLDGLFPGLQRVALSTNYRCAEDIVAHSRELIDCNHVRFRKTIRSTPEHGTGTIKTYKTTKVTETASDIATLLGTKRRGEIAVLARTTNALRPLALACAAARVRIDGPRRLFEPTGARGTLQRHLSLALDPEQATERLVRAVCKTPARYVPDERARVIARRLQRREPFEQAFAMIDAPGRENGDGPALLAPGELFSQLARTEDAAEAVALLRGAGGLDRWFEYDDSLDGLDQFESEVLEQAAREARGLTTREYLDELNTHSKMLRAIRDRRHGRELSTIHGAKGLQWPHVVLIACDEDMLPHALAIDVSQDALRNGEGPEAERRLAYVAFTRAETHLDIHYGERPSRFLRESKILPPEIAATNGRPQPAPPKPPAWGR